MGLVLLSMDFVRYRHNHALMQLLARQTVLVVVEVLMLLIVVILSVIFLRFVTALVFVGSAAVALCQ